MIGTKSLFHKDPLLYSRDFRKDVDIINTLSASVKIKAGNLIQSLDRNI